MAKNTMTALSNSEVAAFCSQMAMILQSGISSTEGISLIMEETTEEEEKKLLEKISETLEMTGSFHEALKSTGAYPDYMLQMVQIGEDTGKLDEVMKSLAEHYDREASISRSIKSAVTYPLIMIIMMIVVILILLTKVMPIFQQVYKQLGSEMSGVSRVILNVGNAISNSSLVLVIILAVIAAAVIYFARTGKGRAQLRAFCSHFKGMRDYMERLASCRFASCMVLTLSSGLAPEEGLSYAENMIDSVSMKEKIQTCRSAMEEGMEFNEALAQAGIFSGVYARLAAIGAKTGSMDEMMRDIANRYQEEIDRRIVGIIGALEPALVIVLSFVVGLILLSVMLPLMGIMSNL